MDEVERMASLIVMGSGLIGLRHIEVIKAHPDCKLAGVIEPDTSRHTDPEICYFTSIDDVDVEVDGAIIATPTFLHKDNGIAAAKRGWHMLIEKPVTATPEEALALSEAVDTAGLHCLVGHHRRQHPAIHKLKEIVQDGRIGTIVTSSLIWAMRKPDDYFQNNWRSTDGSPVMINLIHDIDLIRFVLGEIDDIQAIAGKSLRDGGRVESGAILMRMASGLTATISFADTTPSPWGFEAGINENPHIAESFQDMWWITGTKGAVSFPSLTLWTGASHWGESPVPTKIDVPSITPLMQQITHFLAVMAGEEAPLITISDAAASLAATHKIEQLLAAQIR